MRVFGEIEARCPSCTSGRPLRRADTRNGGLLTGARGAAGGRSVPADESARDRVEAMLAVIRTLYPLNRSITGEGVRETLREVAKIAPVTLHEVPTGTRVLDWEIPREWNVREAHVTNAAGERILDFRRNTLHVLGYSTPVHRRMGRAELTRNR